MDTATRPTRGNSSAGRWMTGDNMLGTGFTQMHTDKFEMGCTKIKTVLRKIKEQDARRYTQIENIKGFETGCTQIHAD